jgi:beta-phosphoglucomutase-like phosphatase (HAD superfamily)
MTGPAICVAAIVLDFDGVILESTDVKTRAFRELFRDWPRHLDAIERFHLEHEGVSRYKKFKWIYRNLIGEPLDDSTMQRLDREFSALVMSGVLNSPFVTGAHEFLESYSLAVPLYIASGTPEPEMQEIVRRRGLEGYFAGVFGSPATKRQIAQRIVDDNRLRAPDCLLVGDALADLDGAESAGMRFVARIKQGCSTVFPAARTFLQVRDLAELSACLSRRDNRLWVLSGTQAMKAESAV